MSNMPAGQNVSTGPLSSDGKTERENMLDMQSPIGDGRRRPAPPAQGAPVSGETRIVDPRTGGAKGQKIYRYDLLPWDILEEDAKLYGLGARKYAPRNWERGYAWSLSMAALLRHLKAFWQDKQGVDPEGGFHHLAAVRFHAAALMRYEKEHPELDDRPGGS